MGLINISPWVIALLIDLVLYIVRKVWFEIPIWGGRARGEIRPQAPVYPDRERRRTLSLVGFMSGGSPGRVREEERRRKEEGLRNRGHKRNVSAESIEENEDEGSTIGLT